MKVLVANIGSTSFKYRLYEMPAETLLARGGVERIGSDRASSHVSRGADRIERTGPVPDHGAALATCLEQLTDPEHGCLAGPQELAAVGFKAVHARATSGIQRVDGGVLAAMEAYATVAPAHNPPYLRAMRQLRERFPALPLVAAFETDFHRTVPAAYQYYAIPWEWCERGIRRWGFHGASHRYITGRIAELVGRSDLRLISCHLGGSSSLAAVHRGQSVGNSLGMSPQSGLPHNNRVGDFDVFALPAILRETGLSLEEVLDVLAERSGLAGLSGAGNDLRDIERSAAQGHERARLAIDVFVAAIRDYLGAYLVRLGGVDVLAFTGGIGENSSLIRQEVCRGLDPFGIVLDPEKNVAAQGEMRISKESSPAQIWILPTNEEIIVARQTYAALNRTQ